MCHQDLDHLVLAGEAGDVQGGVALLRRRVDLRAPRQQLRDDALVPLLAGKVQGVESVLAEETVWDLKVSLPLFRLCRLRYLTLDS